MGRTCPFRAAAAAQQPAQAETANANCRRHAELDQLAPNHRDIAPRRERVIVAAGEPLLGIDQLDIDTVAGVDQVRLTRSEDSQCIAKNALAQSRPRDDLLSG